MAHLSVLFTRYISEAHIKMLKDRTADHLRDKASSLRETAGTAEDECVRQALLTNAADLDRLIGMITPVLTNDRRTRPEVLECFWRSPLERVCA